jgi:pentatricopeptide repeat protein
LDHFKRGYRERADQRERETSNHDNANGSSSGGGTGTNNNNNNGSSVDGSAIPPRDNNNKSNNNNEQQEGGNVGGERGGGPPRMSAGNNATGRGYDSGRGRGRGRGYDSGRGDDSYRHNSDGGGRGRGRGSYYNGGGRGRGGGRGGYLGGRGRGRDSGGDRYQHRDSFRDDGRGRGGRGGGDRGRSSFYGGDREDRGGPGGRGGGGQQIIMGLDIQALVDRLVRPGCDVFRELDNTREGHMTVFNSGKAVTAIISNLARRRNLRIANGVWDWIDYIGIEKNTFHYNSMISACEKVRDYNKALRLLDEMKEKKVSKNEVTYVYLILQHGSIVCVCVCVCVCLDLI